MKNKYVYCVFVEKQKTFQLMALFIYDDIEKARLMKKSAEEVFKGEYVRLEKYEVR